MGTETRKVCSLGACTLLGLICGTLYLYSSYGPGLTSRLGYSGAQSSLVAFSGSLGVSLAGIPASPVIDSKGFTVPVLAGGLAIGVGFLGLRDQYVRDYASLGLSVVFMGLVGCGAAFINSSIIKCAAILYPSHRGVATSFPVSAYGLSAFVFSSLNLIFFQDNLVAFVSFLGYGALAITGLSLPLLYWTDLAESAAASESSYTSRSRPESPSPAPSSLELQTFRSSSLHRELVSKKPRGPDSPGSVLKDLNFWRLFTLLGCLAGLGQMYIYSLGYIVRSLVPDAPEVQQNTQVAIVSMANWTGRILSGIVGDVLSNKYHKSRSWILYIPSTVLLAVQVLGFLVTDVKWLWLVSVLCGIGYGFTWSSIPQILIEFFGIQSLTFSWGIIGLSAIMPTFLLTRLFGSVYDSHLVKAETGNLVCVAHSACYRDTFKYSFAVGLLALLLTIWLTSAPAPEHQELHEL